MAISKSRGSSQKRRTSLDWLVVTLAGALSVAAIGLSADDETDDRRPFFFPYLLDDHDWIFVGPTLRGILSDHRGANAKIGFEGGVSLPVLFGMDVGVGVGSLFARDRNAEWDIRGRIFLGMWQQGLYIGGAHVPSMRGHDYGMIGWQGSSVFGEIDIRKGTSTALTAIPQFGLRSRF